MRNRIAHIYDDAQSWRTDGERQSLDTRPKMRLLGLFAAMLLPFLAITGRLAYLQVVLGEQYIAQGEYLAKTVEPIPSRDGRILTSDGRVLAYDVQQFSVYVHYRWLEEPPNGRWLRSQAFSRLSRRERRDKEKLESAKQQVLADRETMWSRLATITKSDSAELSRRRSQIQKRVERIAESVERRRQAQRTSIEEIDATESLADIKHRSWSQRVWAMVVETLTTPPERGNADPIIVKEELDDHEIISGVTLDVAGDIESHSERYPGVRIEVSTRRAYPEGGMAAHVVGSRLNVHAEDIAHRQKQFPEGDPLDYREGDRIGKTGVERTYDTVIRGVRGRRQVFRNRQGEIIRTEDLRQPRVGDDIVLTLDYGLQRHTEELLDRAIRERWELTNVQLTSFASEEAGKQAGGCIVAMDVRTGAILAAASAPRFDLESIINPNPETWAQLMNDPRRPFFPRPAHMTLPPGSVFKALTAIALLESGAVEPRQPFFCRGYLDNPDGHRCFIFRHHGVGHQNVTLKDALSRSCNVYFFDAARRLGPEPILTWAKRFGFGGPSGVDLPGEKAGHLPVPHDDWEKLFRKNNSRRLQRWYPGDTLGLAIGQTRLTVTPIQVARMMAAIANDGQLVTPHVVRDIGTARFGDSDIDNRSRAQTAFPIPGLSRGTLKVIREGLEQVVAHPRGTGHRTVRLKNIAIAGKTGTAEVGSAKGDHAWFAGYVPADKPRVAFCVVLEHAGSGGKFAGPVARELVRGMIERGIVEPDR